MEFEGDKVCPVCNSNKVIQTLINKNHKLNAKCGELAFKNMQQDIVIDMLLDNGRWV